MAMLDKLVPVPMPTPAPQPIEIRGLEKRATDTCGWASGNLNDPVTCNPGYQCATNLVYDAFGCCSGLNLATCTLATTCLDRTDAIEVLTTADQFTQLCLLSLAPSCVTFNFPGGFRGFGCGLVNTASDIATSVSGQVASGITSAVSITGATRPATAAGSTGPFNAPVQTVVQTTNSGDDGGGGLSTGAIVGIAVAGAVVAIVAITVLGFICYKRTRREPTIVPQPQAQQQYYNPNYPSPDPGAGYFNKDMSQVSGGGVGSVGIPPSQPTSPCAPPTNQQSGSSIPGAVNHGAGGSQVGSGIGTAVGTAVGSASGSGSGAGSSQPMTQANMNAHLHGSGGSDAEWAFMQKSVTQTQTAALPVENDGIKTSVITPQEAVDEPQAMPGQQQQYPSYQNGQQQQVYTGTGSVVSGGRANSPYQYQIQQQQPQQQQFIAGQYSPSHPGSPPPQQQQQPLPGGMVHHTGQHAPTRYGAGQNDDVMSSMAPTALAPTAISHYVQGA